MVFPGVSCNVLGKTAALVIFREIVAARRERARKTFRVVMFNFDRRVEDKRVGFIYVPLQLRITSYHEIKVQEECTQGSIFYRL